MKRAFITGITGQDGSYLAELLLEKGYEVHGLIRRASTFNTGRIDHIFDHENLTLHHGDVLDGSALTRLLGEIGPDEIYHLAAQSHVRVSFDCPEYTCEATGLGTVRLLEAVRAARIRPRIYQASSSEQFGNEVNSETGMQDETTPFRPVSPYGCAKTFAHHYAVNFRERTGLFVACGILFNHESPRRGETFVTRKIAKAAAQIAAARNHGLPFDKLRLGNVNAQRDWGYAPEYVAAMWQMLQLETPEDFVLATSATMSVADFAHDAFAAVDLFWADHVATDLRYQRPTELHCLRGNPAKAVRQIGWQPKVLGADIARLMVAAEVSSLQSPVSNPPA